MRKIKLFTSLVVISMLCGCAQNSSVEKTTAALVEQSSSLENEETDTTEISETATETTTNIETTSAKGTEEESTGEDTTEESTEVETETEDTAEDTSAETTIEDETTAEVITEAETTVNETTDKEIVVETTTVAPTTESPTTVAPTTEVPTTEVPTTEAPKPTIKKIEASVNGTHYVGDTLGANDFVVKVTMSDGSEITNPAGFTVSPLTLGSTSNTLTVGYEGVSNTFIVKATEKPVETKPAETQPAETQPAETHAPETQSKSQGTATVGTYSGATVLDAAFNCLACPYKLGGTTREGFDCSGFVAYCYAQAGVSIPTGTAGQKTCGTKHDMWDAYIGDIVVTEADGWIHTGIYAGNGMVYEARDGQGVTLNEIATYDAIDNSKTGRKIYVIRPGNNTSKIDLRTQTDEDGSSSIWDDSIEQWDYEHNLGLNLYRGDVLTINGRNCDLTGRLYNNWFFWGESNYHYMFRNDLREYESIYPNSYMFTDIW